MNTDEQPQTSQPEPQAANEPAQAPAPQPVNDPLAGLVGDLQQVDTSNPQASQNETSISDNNGERIELGEDGSTGNVIRK